MEEYATDLFEDGGNEPHNINRSKTKPATFYEWGKRPLKTILAWP